MAELLGLPPPEVSGAAGLHDDVGGFVSCEEDRELLAGQTFPFGNDARAVRDCDLENRLG